MTGPQQSLSSNKCHRNGFGSISTASIKFKTSATLLRNMFPTRSYSFKLQDTVALASLTVEAHRNVEWLGFHGFNRVSLEIHGVNYTMSDGSIVSGNFLPVMFENSAEVMTAGREDTGYPTIFSDIDLEGTTGEPFLAKLSWKGTRWATIWLRDLKGTAESDTESDQRVENRRIFVHKYIQTTNGKAGKLRPAVEEDILITEERAISRDASIFDGERATTNGTQVPASVLPFSASSDAGFKIEAHSRRVLPTLHHIVSRIAELPIFDVVEAVFYEEEGEKVVRASRMGP
jgi:hypothetical protein